MTGCNNCGADTENEPFALCDECNAPPARDAPCRCEELQWLLDRIYDTLGLKESDRCPDGVAGYEASVRRRNGGVGEAP